MKTFTAVALLLGFVAMTTSAPFEVEKRAVELPCHFRGKQYDSGTTFSISSLKCIVFQCNDGSVNIKQDGCRDKEDVCHAVASTWKISTCVTMKCNKEKIDGEITYSSSIEKMGCENDNQCYDIDTTYKSKCVTYKCTLKVDQITGRKTLRQTIASIECEDKDGNCHTEDDIFSMQIEGIIYKTCRCVINNLTTSYSCSG